MKKTIKYSLIIALLFVSILMPIHTNAFTDGEENLDVYTEASNDSIVPYADFIYSNKVKNDMGFACRAFARTSTNHVASLLETPFINENDELNSTDTSIELFNVNLTSEVRTSKQGSRIVMVAGNHLTNHGYCHIFMRHMENSNGNKKYSVNGVSQFTIARYPSHIMDIIMDVVDGTTLLVPDTSKNGRYYKIKTIGEEGNQNVKVILQRGSSMTGFEAYDWVVITTYPVF
ncbi:hypothetical protein [Metasolibacillus sp. FSL K6-0083]|uniref:hypothetical protein n=1 Tax=Metasolibacillus sp. FSL K6-0083 TaxID=2921416 RepID=UPI00315AD11D